MEIITAHNLSVEIPVFGLRKSSLKTSLLDSIIGCPSKIKNDTKVIQCLNNISFKLETGDRLGIIGPNGSGKSTLLRVIAGILEPTNGNISTSGSISTMLDISLGMNPDCTGIENIILRCTLMGMKKKCINAAIGEIIEFSELGEYIHMPLRTYSSGMSMRLAFAISTSIPAEIILMDEWLSVGDSSFNLKAQDRLAKLINDSKALVIASHDMKTIESSCNKILELNRGDLISFRKI